MYCAADYARTWYDLGVWFDDEHPELELACGRPPKRVEGNGPPDGPWHVFDYAQQRAVDR